MDSTSPVSRSGAKPGERFSSMGTPSTTNSVWFSEPRGCNTALASKIQPGCMFTRSIKPRPGIADCCSWICCAPTAEAMPVLCGSIKVAASVTSTSVAAASTFNSKRISRGTADRISISDDERVKLACSTVNRYMPKGRCWKVKRPASSVLNSRRVWDAALTKVPEEGSARPVESLTESRSSPVSTCPHTNPHASRINPIRIPVLSSYQSRGKTRYPVEYVNSTDEAQAEDIAKTESPMQAETVRLAVIVPAYRPEESLLQLIGALSEKSIPAIVLVDDGSGPDYRETFRRAEEFPKVRLVRHAINLGKGAALKTGINYALCAFPGLQGVVTADADGQHHPDDIEQVADRLAAEPDRVVLGTRTFSGGVPLRSRVGNVVTRTVMRALVGLSATCS